MVKSKKGKTHQMIVHKEAYQRMNFLYQAACLALAQHPYNLQLSQMYIRTMKAISQKLVLRIDPNIKRSLCKSCDSPLIPGLSCINRLNGHREKHVTVTCISCGAMKRFMSRKEHRLHSDRCDVLESVIK